MGGGAFSFHVNVCMYTCAAVHWEQVLLSGVSLKLLLLNSDLGNLDILPSQHSLGRTYICLSGTKIKSGLHPPRVLFCFLSRWYRFKFWFSYLYEKNYPWIYLPKFLKLFIFYGNAEGWIQGYARVCLDMLSNNSTFYTVGIKKPDHTVTHSSLRSCFIF